LDKYKQLNIAHIEDIFNLFIRRVGLKFRE
jgi:hypothetical protein